MDLGDQGAQGTECKTADQAGLEVALVEKIKVEDDEDEGEIELDWVARHHINIFSLFVGCLDCILDLFKLGILGVLLDCGDSSACGALAADKVLEGDGEEVALVGVDSATLLGEDGLKELDHILEALGLLSDTGEENFLFDVDHL